MKSHHKALALLVPMLAACASGPPPEPRIVTRTAPVPVAVACAVAVARPDLPDIAAATRSANDIDVLARAYRAYWLLANPYIAQLEGALKGCGGGVP